MNFNQLKYFVAVAEQQSFTKAAAQYYLSQTAITQQIRVLEDTVGLQLLDRTTRPVSLTPAGSVFLGEARAILERMDTALDRTRDASTGLVGALRVGYTKGYERSNLSNRLRAFHLDYPNILITCYRRNTDALAAGLVRGDYDVIFTWDSTDLRQEEGLESLMVERAPLVVALYAAHPLARRRTLERKELKGEKILYMSPSGTGDSFGDAYFLELYRKAGYQPDILLRSNDVESILIMVAAEEGISILPAYTTDKLTDAENLVFVPLTGEGEWEEILAVWRREDSSVPLRRFLQQLS